MMKPGIYLKRIYSDGDLLELKIEVSDGISMFTNSVYVSSKVLDGIIADLDTFSQKLNYGNFDVHLGKYGQRWASGAFKARIHFASPGRLYITCRLQSLFFQFAEDEVASEATLYLRSEPALLDKFVAELKSLNANTRDDAYLEGVQ